MPKSIKKIRPMKGRSEFKVATRTTYDKIRVGYTCIDCGNSGGCSDFSHEEVVKAYHRCHVCGDGVSVPSVLYQRMRSNFKDTTDTNALKKNIADLIQIIKYMHESDNMTDEQHELVTKLYHLTKEKSND